MKIIIYTLYSILFLGMLLSFVHPIHLSVTNIEANTQNKTLEVTHRFFVEDFEARLEREYQVELNLGTSKEHPEADAYIHRFLNQSVDILVNGKSRERTFIGKEVASEAIWIYIEVSGIKRIKELAVKNNILTDTFDDQSNFINFKYDEGKKAVILTAQKPQSIVYISE